MREAIVRFECGGEGGSCIDVSVTLDAPSEKQMPRPRMCLSLATTTHLQANGRDRPRKATGLHEIAQFKGSVDQERKACA